MERCSNCNAEIESGDAFCRGCGERQSPASPRAAQAERRELTAFFYDLVGSTELSTRTDPEDLEFILERYQRMCADVVRNFGGTPANTMGDGGLVYFGFPTAHEDDPIRAVMAGRALLAELAELNDGLRREIRGFDDGLSMRIGVHTGTVVLGAEGSDHGGRRLAVGQTLNQAARIESLAPTDGIAVSEVTAQRIQGVVELSSLGHHELKGIDEPVELFRVDRVRTGQVRFVSTQSTSPLVGRDGEYARLRDEWTRATLGEARSLLLVGEAGIGKSRLHQQLRAELSSTLHTWIELNGVEVFAQTAFHPLVLWIRQALGFQEPPAEIDRQRLMNLLERNGIDDPERTAHLAEFVGFEVDSLGELPPEEHRRRTIEAVCDLLLGVASRMPTVIVAEDMHWFDPSTLAVLRQLQARAPSHSMLLVGTSRPDTVHAYGATWEQLVLEPLSLDEVHRIVDHLGADLPAERRDQIAERADGVPLFAEEMVNALNDLGGEHTGDGTSADTVPSSLRGLLTARLDRVGSSRHVLQVAALLGREFSRSLLAGVLADDGDLDQHLSALVDGGFLAQRGVGDKAEFLFRHALLQDAARDSMLKRQRTADHRRIADHLAAAPSGRDAHRPEVIGYHYAQAGDPERAIPYFETAGREARSRAAVHEAAAHLRRAVDLLLELEPSDTRDLHELTLRLELGSALALGDSFSSPEVKTAFERAAELSADDERRAAEYGEALNGLLQHHVSAATYDDALEIGERLRVWAEERHDRVSELAAHRALCQVHLWPGRFAEVWEHATRAYELYDPDGTHGDRHALGIETGVLALTYAAFGAWALGYVEQSRTVADEAIALAAAQDDVYQECFAGAYLSVHSIMLNDPERCQRLADRTHRLSVEHGYLPLAGLTKWARGWARAARGDAAGLDEAIEGVDELAGIGVGAGAPGCMAVLAEMCAQGGRVDLGFDYAALGLAMADGSGQHFYTVELHRSLALLHLERADAAADADAAAAELDAAEAAAREALELARRQASPSLERRALEPLITVMERRGDRAGAEPLLDEIASRAPDAADELPFERAPAGPA